MIFGVTLNRHGWRIDYLGVDTPVEEHRWSPQPAAALLRPNGLRLAAGYACLPRRSLLVLRSRVPHWCSS